MFPKKSFKTVALDGTVFEVFEFATYRLERGADSVLRPVENQVSELATDYGLEVVPDEDPWCYRIPVLGITVRVIDKPVTLRAGIRRHPSTETPAATPAILPGH